MRDDSQSIVEVILNDTVHVEGSRLGIPEQPSIGEQYIKQPTNALAAAVLFEHLGSDVIYDKHLNCFWKKTMGGYYEPFNDLLTTSTSVLVKAAKKALNRLEELATDDEIGKLHVLYAAALKKSRTKDFVQNSLTYFAERVLVPDLAFKWNITPMTLPTRTDIIDFSGETTILRKPNDEEYFKNPLDLDGKEVIEAGEALNFLLFLLDIFPDKEVQQTAIECISLMLANTGNRIFPVFIGQVGSNGKNTLIDIFRILFPGRVGVVPAATIIKNDTGAQRFAASTLEGLQLAAVDEVQGAFSVPEIKRLTGQSTITIERKGLSGYEIPQKWLLIALSNHMPTFQPVTDTAFLHRLILIPFDTVFYYNDEEKKVYLKDGVEESRLREIRSKEELIDSIKKERAAIVKFLIGTLKTVKAKGGRPFECQRCLQMKHSYQSKNDVIAEFFKENFTKDLEGRVTYSRMIELWKEFSGEKNPSIRDVLHRLIERFPWLERKTSNSTKYLAGIREEAEDIAKAEKKEFVSIEKASDPISLKYESTEVLNFNKAIG